MDTVRGLLKESEYEKVQKSELKQKENLKTILGSAQRRYDESKRVSISRRHRALKTAIEKCLGDEGLAFHETMAPGGIAQWKENLKKIKQVKEIENSVRGMDKKELKTAIQETEPNRIHNALKDAKDRLRREYNESADDVLSIRRFRKRKRSLKSYLSALKQTIKL